jgi:hypothetical protein
MMMEGVSTSETSVIFYQTTRPSILRNIPEDSHLHTEISQRYRKIRVLLTILRKMLCAQPCLNFMTEANFQQRKKQHFLSEKKNSYQGSVSSTLGVLKRQGSSTILSMFH